MIILKRMVVMLIASLKVKKYRVLIMKITLGRFQQLLRRGYLSVSRVKKISNHYLIADNVIHQVINGKVNWSPPL